MIDDLAPLNEITNDNCMRLWRCVFIQVVRDACQSQQAAIEAYEKWAKTQSCAEICLIIGVPHSDAELFFKKISECEKFRQYAKDDIKYFKSKNTRTGNKILRRY